MIEFVHKDSIVRKIWGKSDTVLFIFAGAAAEFAVNKQADWLYFTGRLPEDPLGRLFSTVAYARQIIFSPLNDALTAIDRMSNIHASVEKARGTQIPAAAYRDVLFMLIHYSIVSFEVLERKLTDDEKEDVVNVFVRVGRRMDIPALPQSYPQWQQMYFAHNEQNLERTTLTADLFRQYRKHLGWLRYLVLIEVQKLIVTDRVRQLLGFKRPVFIRTALKSYKLSRNLNADKFFKSLLLPPLYKQKIRALDIPSGP
jgi:hypothetical protein